MFNKGYSFAAFKIVENKIVAENEKKEWFIKEEDLFFGSQRIAAGTVVEDVFSAKALLTY